MKLEGYFTTMPSSTETIKIKCPLLYLFLFNTSSKNIYPLFQSVTYVAMLIVLAVFQRQKPQYYKMKSWSDYDTLNVVFFPKKSLPEKIPNIFRHGAFLYFWKGIFKILAYLELEAHSEHCQTRTMECFAKIAAQLIFRPQPQNFSRQIL